ncbi:MAG: hypothetical protein IJZ65_03875, partial [Ruminiclostridium sp.]|nr:hypothetical protein [Ruminiclostridium sp.]
GQESVHGAVSGCIVTRPAVGRNAERKYDYQELYLIVRLFLISAYFQEINVMPLTNKHCCDKIS